MIRHPWAVAPVLLAISVASPAARGQADPIVARGVQYLRSSPAAAASNSSNTGEAALAALALLKAEVPPSDPAIVRTLGLIQKRFSESTYVPEKGSGVEIYEAAVVILALSTLDASSHGAEIGAAAQFLLGKQNPSGSWDYQGREFGDTSITQYALLGLWEAENSGASIPPGVWDRAAQFYLRTQGTTGGWTYHRDGGGAETVAMSAAAVSSLLICDRQLAPYRTAMRVAHPLLIPLDQEAERRRFTPSSSPRQIAQAVQSGMAFITANFTVSNPAIIGQSANYALYGIERIGALADKTTLGKRDWYADGRSYLASKQLGNGSFPGSFGETPNTAWAVLFLTKSTAKTITKIQLRRLGAGTLIGGRGLPRDLSQISVAGGHVIARPMDGAVEGMLAVLEDPRAEDAASALAGLVARYRTEGPNALRPFQDRFKKLLTDPDQGVRRVAAWSLARTGDLATALPLIEALRDPDEGVVTEARQGLQLLSRKLEPLGPPPSATSEQKDEAIARWRAWYEAVRPIAATADEAPAARRAP